MSRTKTVHIGPQDTSEGQQLTIVRQFTADGEPTSETRTYVKYVASGVVDVDIQDPYNMGTGDPESQIGLTFSSGHREYVNGVITEIPIDSGNDDAPSIRSIIAGIEEQFDEGAHIDTIISRSTNEGYSVEEVRDRIETLRTRGDVYEPKEAYYLTT